MTCACTCCVGVWAPCGVDALKEVTVAVPSLLLLLLLLLLLRTHRTPTGLRSSHAGHDLGRASDACDDTKSDEEQLPPTVAP